jgi:hypothetical protein
LQSTFLNTHPRCRQQWLSTWTHRPPEQTHREHYVSLRSWAQAGQHRWCARGLPPLPIPPHRHMIRLDRAHRSTMDHLNGQPAPWRALWVSMAHPHPCWLREHAQNCGKPTITNFTVVSRSPHKANQTKHAFAWAAHSWQARCRTPTHERANLPRICSLTTSRTQARSFKMHKWAQQGAK